MATSFQNGSATIYQFPVRGRFALAARGDQFESAAKMVRPEVAIALGSGWYHDEAIEAERARKN